jgi:hypothetical protein
LPALPDAPLSAATFGGFAGAPATPLSIAPFASAGFGVFDIAGADEQLTNHSTLEPTAILRAKSTNNMPEC